MACCGGLSPVSLAGIYKMGASNTGRAKAGKDSPVRLTKKLINEYRDSLVSRGCKEQTVNMYYCYLNKLYHFLPESKELTEANLTEWVNDLYDKGLSDRTVNLYLSSANGLLKYCGKKKVPMSSISAPRDAELPELTRDEYLQLLSYVKNHESERNYLLIETLATVDIAISELPYLTVEACQKGVIKTSGNKEIRIPDGLRQELLSHAREKNMHTGPIFISNYGNLLDRTDITHMIERMGRDAGIAPGKSNPRALHRLCRRTQEELNEKLMTVYTKAYDDLLNQDKDKIEQNS